MGSIIEIMSAIQSYVVIGLVIVIITLIILVIILFNSFKNLEKRYRKIMRGVNNKNLEELIVGYLDKIDDATKISNEVKAKYDNMDLRIKGCIQKTSLVRYKSFDDVGSDLSFSIALLDDNSNGLLLTGIYGRNDSTTYAKPIDKGISRYELSEEEEHVLKAAMNEESIKNIKK